MIKIYCCNFVKHLVSLSNILFLAWLSAWLKWSFCIFSIVNPRLYKAVLSKINKDVLVCTCVRLPHDFISCWKRILSRKVFRWRNNVDKPHTQNSQQFVPIPKLIYKLQRCTKEFSSYSQQMLKQITFIST